MAEKVRNRLRSVEKRFFTPKLHLDPIWNRFRSNELQKIKMLCPPPIFGRFGRRLFKFVKGLKLLKKKDLKFGLNNCKNFPGVRPPDPSSVTNAIYPPLRLFFVKMKGGGINRFHEPSACLHKSTLNHNTNKCSTGKAS